MARRGTMERRVIGAVREGSFDRRINPFGFLRSLGCTLEHIKVPNRVSNTQKLYSVSKTTILPDAERQTNWMVGFRVDGCKEGVCWVFWGVGAVIL